MRGHDIAQPELSLLFSRALRLIGSIPKNYAKWSGVILPRSGLVQIRFSPHNIVSEQDLTDAVRKLQKFRNGAEPACQVAPTESRVSTVRSAFVN